MSLLPTTQEEWVASLLAAAHLTACAGLVWSSICRLSHTDACTDRWVRWAFVALGGSGLLGAGAVLLGYAPAWHEVVLVISMLGVQAISARLWQRGVPSAHRTGRHARWADSETTPA